MRGPESLLLNTDYTKDFSLSFLNLEKEEFYVFIPRLITEVLKCYKILWLKIFQTYSSEGYVLGFWYLNSLIQLINTVFLANTTSKIRGRV